MKVNSIYLERKYSIDPHAMLVLLDIERECYTQYFLTEWNNYYLSVSIKSRQHSSVLYVQNLLILL